MSDTDFDFALDERQRSMLEAMGIKLWLPEAQQAATSVFAQEAVAKPVFEQNKGSAGIEAAQSAPKKVAPLAPSLTSQPSAAAAPISLAPRPSGIEQMDWQALQTAVASCEACGLCQSRKNTVFGVGQTPQVDWLIVGEAPGENEDAQGKPFVGQAGKLLDNMLAAMKIGQDGQGLSRSEGVYIANVLKCRPPANRNPSPEEVAMCEPYLARQIALLRPKIILAMGKFAIQTLTGSNEPVGKLRGRLHTLQHTSYQAPVIVTYHPAYLLRNLPDKAKAWADLLLAMQTYRELPNESGAA
ncbi:MAG: uracil-DNA glycosylase family protein [Brachymonas sp.]